MGLVCAVFILFTFSGNFYRKTNCERTKRAYSDKFNILLSLFKVKPLEGSEVYKAFSNSLLLPRRKLGDAMPYGEETSSINVAELNLVQSKNIIRTGLRSVAKYDMPENFFRTETKVFHPIEENTEANRITFRLEDEKTIFLDKHGPAEDFILNHLEDSDVILNVRDPMKEEVSESFVSPVTQDTTKKTENNSGLVEEAVILK